VLLHKHHDRPAAVVRVAIIDKNVLVPERAQVGVDRTTDGRRLRTYRPAHHGGWANGQEVCRVIRQLHRQLVSRC